MSKHDVQPRVRPLHVVDAHLNRAVLELLFDRNETLRRKHKDVVKGLCSDDATIFVLDETLKGDEITLFLEVFDTPNLLVGMLLLDVSAND